MKKLMIVAAALAAGVAFADEIQSANIVGYASTTITGTDESGNVKWNLLGFQFKGVSSEDGTIALADAIDMKNIPAFTGTWRNRTKDAPCLQFYNGVGYDFYYWVGDTCSGLGKDCWVSGSKVEATRAITSGSAGWFSAKTLGTASATITFAGSVKTDASSTVSFTEGSLALGTNPYPMAYNIKDIGITIPAYTGTWRNRTTSASCIQVYNGVGYDFYYWVGDACSGLGKDAWVAGSKAETTGVIGVGQAFWFKNMSGTAGTLTFTYKAE